MMEQLFRVGQILDGQDGDCVLKILHANKFYVWIGDVSFALPPKVGSTGDKKSLSRGHVKQPYVEDRSAFEKNIEAGDVSAVDLQVPEHWRIVDSETNTDWSSTQQQKRNPRKWQDKNEKLFELIEPLIKEHKHIEIILELDLYKSWPLQRAIELKLSSPKKVYDTLNRYLIGGGKHALTPAYVYSGAPGRPRFNSKRSGRSNANERSNPNLNLPQYVTSAADRQMLAKGFKRHKRKGVSIETAYARTLVDFFAASKRYDASGEVHVTLKELRPTKDQFIYWGSRVSENLNASEINDGQSKNKRRTALRSGHEHASVTTVATLGELDSTGGHQNLVSEASTLKVLRSPTRSVLVDVAHGYVCGLYVGFESASTWTSLMTILSAAESKVEFCARFGISITEAQWLTIVPREIVIDNGEAKSIDGMTGVEATGASLMFTPSYFGEAKPSIESENRSTHAAVDHAMPGSTQGRQRERGEADPALEACMTFHDYMRRLIQHYLWKNNEEYYPVPTIEMRRDGVKPTRQSVMLWCIENGYVSSMPLAADVLRARCLPKFEGVVGSQGIELFDPTVGYDKLIKGLVYNSAEFRSLGLCGNRRKRCTVQLDPTDLSHVFVNEKKFLKVPMNTRDPNLSKLTLLDWLSIQQDDDLAGYLNRQTDIARRATNVAEMDRQNRAAKKKKKAEVAALDEKPTKVGMTSNRAENTREELLRMAQTEQIIPTQESIQSSTVSVLQPIPPSMVVNPDSYFLSKRKIHST